MAKRRREHDPFASREAQRYENPIPSREHILSTLTDHGKPATRQKLQKLLQIQPEQHEAFTRRLKAMARDGQLISTRRHEYGLVTKMNLIPGRVIGHRDGFGFVVPDEGGDDLFLPSKYMRTVFDGDRVLVRVAGIDKRSRREAALVQVLEHKTTQIVGRLHREDGVYFVIPDHKRMAYEILIAPGEEKKAKNGQIVTVELISQPSFHKRAVGRVIEVLGKKRAPGMEIDIAVRSHGLPYQWSPEVLEEAEKFEELTLGKKYKDRKNICDLPLVTIDGEDAKDFDDAVYCEARPRGGWRLVVAIADVSHYVKPLTPLDTEAFARGNSVYFPSAVIPMLPEALSNGLCSLKPKVDRFCLVCDMQISAKGNITRYEFYSAVMHSRARLTYTQVATALSGDKKACSTLGDLLPSLEEFHRLYQRLLQNRQERGALDFETVETKVVFTPQKKIKAIVPVIRNDAHKMIEEAMLCANVCAAKFLIKNNAPALYRVHEGPTPEKLTDLRNFLKEFNLGLRGGNTPKSGDYADLLKSIIERPDARLIQTVLLRSLKQAIYSPDNVGHFGLAYPMYTHFTSPIRRYPDLLVHRQIRALLSGKEAMLDEPIGRLAQIGEHCSFTERRADEATRDALDTLKCEFVLNHVGETFSGLITTVTGFGLFVELSNLYVEGLIHISALPTDYYHFDATKHRLMGERSRTAFNLGDTVQVTVVRVDVDERKIDLTLVGAQKHEKPKKRKQRKRR